MTDIPRPRQPNKELEAIQSEIRRIDAEIVLKQMEKVRYEQIGHTIVASMYGIE